MERMEKFSTQLNKIIAISATFVIFFSPALAADFPESGGTITVNMPFGPGGMVDLMARTMAPHWDAKWGMRTVVLNKPGASGQIALTEMLRQKSDGQTIAFTQGFDTQMTYLNAEANAPYSRSSFTPVGQVQSTPSVWIVRADSPHRTMEALLEAARKRPGELNFGTPASRGPAVLLVRASGDVRPVQ
ncbi:Bug family tripartite tricarboxylate transporter substrate binding protein [Variovorax sp. LT1R16]|uniref:Bug family tripartite tricarboxylate transporter substrate binding protein n=1 Tax=Variovorax sp. LT1R16 TaxID=3443728 RepID=UPI003F47E7FC